MKRGTTPTHVFDTNADLTGLQRVYVTYTQGDETLVEKTIDDCTVDGATISTRLTQADTLSFNVGNVKFQFRAVLADGSAIASDIYSIKVERILKDGEI